MAPDKANPKPDAKPTDVAEPSNTRPASQPTPEKPANEPMAGEKNLERPEVEDE